MDRKKNSSHDFCHQLDNTVFFFIFIDPHKKIKSKFFFKKESKGKQIVGNEITIDS